LRLELGYGTCQIADVGRPSRPHKSFEVTQAHGLAARDLQVTALAAESDRPFASGDKSCRENGGVVASGQEFGG
jgi:hypothetical protein